MRGFSSLIAAAFIGFGSTLALAEEMANHWNMQVPAQLEWRAADGLPPGAQIVVLEGDPSKEGYFTMRIKMPDGYRVPAHWHPMDENVTVLTGTVKIGMGEKYDAKAAPALAAGTYTLVPKNMRHFAWHAAGSVIQIHGTGPFELYFVNPAEDPRKTAAK